MKDNYVYPGHQKGPGMEVRDLFAAHAMQGILAHTGIDTPFMEGALAAWVAADFMLDLREKSFEERMAIVAEQAGDEDEYSDKEFLSELAGLIEALKEAGKEGNENAAE
jgi:hypothetical protein